jgi:hypothetical protein
MPGTNIRTHTGSSGRISITSSDAPWMRTSILIFADSMTSTLDFLLAAVFERFPALRSHVRSGGLAGCPYAIRRADKVWRPRTRRAVPTDARRGRRTPISRNLVWNCICDDDTVSLCRDSIGIGQMTVEVHYPTLLAPSRLLSRSPLTCRTSPD